MLNKKTLTDLNASGKRVLVRVDFNVPLKDGKVGDDTRIQAALPTIRHLLAQGATLVLCSHLGRPKGEVKPEFSLHPVAKRLEKLLGQPVAFSTDCVGPIAKYAADKLSEGGVLLLENTRFHAEETKNNPAFAENLASIAEAFVNDAFGTAHRAHASNVGVSQYLPGYAGFLLEKEIEYLDKAVEAPQRPFVAIMGGAKISDKIGVIRNLLTKADYILIGGGMANTFFKAQGFPVADSLVEEAALETAQEILAVAGDKFKLPVDMVIADQFADDAQQQTLDVGAVPDGWRILDVGPKTVAAFGELVKSAGTVVWNGPMGVFEFPNFAKGTFDLARVVADSAATSIIGGGDSVAAVKQSGLADQVSHISTGGGASLKMLEGTELPGLAALQDRG